MPSNQQPSNNDIGGTNMENMFSSSDIVVVAKFFDKCFTIFVQFLIS